MCYAYALLPFYMDEYSSILLPFWFTLSSCSSFSILMNFQHTGLSINNGFQFPHHEIKPWNWNTYVFYAFIKLTSNAIVLLIVKNERKNENETNQSKAKVKIQFNLQKVEFVYICEWLFQVNPINTYKEPYGFHNRPYRKILLTSHV